MIHSLRLCFRLRLAWMGKSLKSKFKSVWYKNVSFLMSLNFLSSIQNVSFLMSPSLIVPLKKVASRNVPSRNVSKNMDDDRSPSSTTITNHESLTQRGISYLCFFSIMNHESRITNHQLKEYVIHTFFSITNHESLIMNHESWIKARIGALGGHME